VRADASLDRNKHRNFSFKVLKKYTKLYKRPNVGRKKRGRMELWHSKQIGRLHFSLLLVVDDLVKQTFKAVLVGRSVKVRGSSILVDDSIAKGRTVRVLHRARLGSRRRPNVSRSSTTGGQNVVLRMRMDVVASSDLGLRTRANIASTASTGGDHVRVGWMKGGFDTSSSSLRTRARANVPGSTSTDRDEL